MALADQTYGFYIPTVSLNAPEFRMYATADTPGRSHEIVESCKRIIPHMIADVINQEPTAGFGPGGP